MSEDNPEIDISEMPFEERFKYFNSQRVVDITNGLNFLIKDGNELIELHFRKLYEDNPQGRFPILGFKDGAILMLGGKNDRFEHAQILDATKRSARDILFATGLEGVNSQASEPYLEIKTTRDVEPMKSGESLKIIIGKSTDLNAPGIVNLSEDRHQILENIFKEMDGVSVHTPSYWK